MYKTSPQEYYSQREFIWHFHFSDFFIVLLLNNNVSSFFRARTGGRQREGENLKQTPVPNTMPDAGLHPITKRPGHKLKSRVGCSTNSATQVPLEWFIFFSPSVQ